MSGAEVALKPCPFCDGLGSVEVIEADDPADTPSWYPGCTDEACIAYEMYAFYDTRAEAIAAWNTRAKENRDDEG